MDVRDAIGGDPLGFEGMDFALPQCFGSLRALWRQAGQTSQEDNRMGLAAALGTKALVPTAGDRGRSRSGLRIAQTARPMPQALRSDHLHHALALGCRPLRTGSATTPPSDREAAPQRRAAAQPFCGGPSP